jgi:NAD(P)-dependent dehydrogenase (short-subunit alcohol dehydrogenase family)
LLLERLKESAPSRIIIVSSVAHNYGSPYDFERIKSPDNESIKSYCDSKLANVMHAKKLAIELKETGVKVYSLHPGSVATDIWRKFPSFMQSVIKTFTISETQGARVTLFCATEPSISNESGKYYDMCKEGKVGKLANDEKLIDELWIKSNEFTKDYQ